MGVGGRSPEADILSDFYPGPHFTSPADMASPTVFGDGSPVQQHRFSEARDTKRQKVTRGKSARRAS